MSIEPIYQMSHDSRCSVAEVAYRAALRQQKPFKNYCDTVYSFSGGTHPLCV